MIFRIIIYCDSDVYLRVCGDWTFCLKTESVHGVKFNLVIFNKLCIYKSKNRNFITQCTTTIWWSVINYGKKHDKKYHFNFWILYLKVGR